MKKFVAIMVLVGVFVFTGLTYGDPPKNVEVNQRSGVIPCPKTTMATDCLTCHVAGKIPGVAGFPVKEAAIDAQRDYPVYGMKVIEEDGQTMGYYLVQSINSNDMQSFLGYLGTHNIKKAVVEIHSPGGGLFDAQRITGLFRLWQDRGMKIETRLMGAAFSAGFYVFVAGDHRLVDPYADLMWHELLSFGGFGFQITTPSDREEEARILRHLQDIRNNYLATRGKLTKKELDEKISKKEFWMSGADAVKFGFADGLITKK